MCVTEVLDFNAYWERAEYFDKRPVRNGSNVMMVGDNIYHRKHDRAPWEQADSHHSNPDGTANPLNVGKDTSANRVLASRHFYYFGRSAPAVPPAILEELGYRNRRGHRVFSEQECVALLEWLSSHGGKRNLVVDDPFDFQLGSKRYTGTGSKLQ